MTQDKTTSSVLDNTSAPDTTEKKASGRRKAGDLRQELEVATGGKMTIADIGDGYEIMKIDRSTNTLTRTGRIAATIPSLEGLVGGVVAAFEMMK